jgi:hypothetical protein
MGPPDSARAEATVGGWCTLAHHEGETGYRLNDMNRSDNAFSTFRLNLEAQLHFEGNLTLNMEYMIDTATRDGFSNTFLRPWATWTEIGGRSWLNAHVGSLPLVFGTYGERANTAANPVIGVPLMHGYHTSFSMFSLPPNGDSLLARGGRGQFGINYRVGGGPKGMVMIYEPCWDAGLELFGATGAVEYAAAVTNGTPSAPVLFGNETNDEPGFVGRLGLSQLPGALFGARVGASFAHGSFYGDGVALDPGLRHEDYDQTIFGWDAEYSVGRVLLRGEGCWNRWELPERTDPATWLPGELESNALYLETRVTMTPGLLLGARYDQVNFDDIVRPDGSRHSWDADVRRAEVALAYRPHRTWELKAAYQNWWYPDAPRFDADLGAIQLRMDF